MLVEQMGRWFRRSMAGVRGALHEHLILDRCVEGNLDSANRCITDTKGTEILLCVVLALQAGHKAG